MGVWVVGGDPTLILQQLRGCPVGVQLSSSVLNANASWLRVLILTAERIRKVGPLQELIMTSLQSRQIPHLLLGHLTPWANSMAEKGPSSLPVSQQRSKRGSCVDMFMCFYITIGLQN